MSHELRSVGLDVGTTTTQMVVSRLQVENRASAFGVPDMQITGRQILYRSPVHFTPLLDKDLVDGEKLRRLIEEEYRNGQITPRQVDTGAVIITGETSRKENAGTVLQQLSHMAGEFVVATAGPDLESKLAAKGSGATAYCAQTGKSVLHMDIGGGTSNLARIENGKIVATGCLNVGGRLLKFRPDGTVDYISPVIQKLTDLRLGQQASREQVVAVATLLVQALEMAAGLRPVTSLLETLQTRECAAPWQILPQEVISFSGGVAACMKAPMPPFAYGDMGSILAQCILESRLCQGAFILGRETVGATVIGAGCHATTLSGSTVFYRNVSFPLKNLQVLPVTGQDMLSVSGVRAAWESAEGQTGILCLPGIQAPDYATVEKLAQVIYEAVGEAPVYLCLQADMAKALGQRLGLLRKADAPLLCMDGIYPAEDSYLDIGAPVGPALPVVIKTLVLG